MEVVLAGVVAEGMRFVPLVSFKMETNPDWEPTCYVLMPSTFPSCTQDLAALLLT
jgi:hypothetical protein